MKRGLKELPSFQFYPGDWRSRAFPDEEGTESCSLARWSRESSPVPEPSPMKRGLKVSSQMRITRSLPSSRAFPDEEGTESDNLGCGRGWTFRSRAFPDEEGTESPSCILDAIEVFRRRSGLCLWVVGPFVPASVTNLCRDG